VADKRKIAVGLFNLGGPDTGDDVRGFLFNLFRDKAIISAPAPVRYPLALMISTLRAKSARANYALMDANGGSPLLPESQKQAEALEASLSVERPDCEWRSFLAMRYWAPYVKDAARAVTDWGADEVILLPLYPHFSTTTSETAFAEWDRHYRGAEDRRVCCYPEDDSFIEAHVKLIRETYEAAGRPENARLLFSAHGLPERTVAMGDPYPWQIERTAAAVAERLPEISDWMVCYQSRVGPLKWIGPATEEAIKQAAEDKRHVILTPIAFVSEHIETLVELDIEYEEIAQEMGVAGYSRVPALGHHPDYIDALTSLAVVALEREPGLQPPNGSRICPKDSSRCPCRIAS